MTSIERVYDALRKEIPAAVELRHRLHADPYVSGSELPTTHAVVEALGWGAGVPVAEAGRLVARRPGRGRACGPSSTPCP